VHKTSAAAANNRCSEWLTPLVLLMAPQAAGYFIF